MAAPLHGLRRAECTFRRIQPILIPDAQCTRLRLHPLTVPPRALQRRLASSKQAKPSAQNAKHQTAQKSAVAPAKKDHTVKAPTPAAQRPNRSASAADVAKQRGPQSDQPTYPDTLLIFKASRPKIYFVAAIKLVGLGLSVLGLNYAGMLYYDPLGESWRAFAVAVLFSVPMAYTIFFTNPFISSVHLHLPTLARSSVSKLEMYINNLPSTARVDITSLRWMLPEVSRASVADLTVVGDPLGSFVLRRKIPEEVRQGIKWYQRRPIKAFMMDEKPSGMMPVPGIWEAMLPRIVRGWPDASRGAAAKKF